MPRAIINASEDWVQLLQAVHGNAIDTLIGIDHQIKQCILEGGLEAAQLLGKIAPQLRDMKRRIEAVRVPR